jgi:hypothetical protein
LSPTRGGSACGSVSAIAAMLGASAALHPLLKVSEFMNVWTEFVSMSSLLVLLVLRDE